MLIVKIRQVGLRDDLSELGKLRDGIAKLIKFNF